MASELRVDKIIPTSGVAANGSGGLVQTRFTQFRPSSGASTTSTSFIDTGLSCSITPKFSTSKILITSHVYVSWTDAAVLRLLRDSTRIPNNTEGNSDDRRGFAMARHEQANEGNTYSITHLDAPSTTSATTYKIQARRDGSATCEINRRYSDNTYSLISSITVQEISQ